MDLNMLFPVVSILLFATHIDWALCLSKPQECGTSMGCFTDGCDGNGDGCDFVVTWVDSTELMTFTLKLPVSGSNDMWIALGLSEDRVMGSDSVTDCIADGNTVTITKSWNSDYKINVALSEDAKTIGLSATSGSISDGVLMCTYTQIKVNSDSQIYDLNTDWHLLVANGIVSGGIKSKHSTTPIQSTDVVDLQSNIGIPALTTTVTPSLSKPQECGTSMGCFTDGCDGNGDGCGFVVTWIDSTELMTFTLKLPVSGSNDMWIALGLSGDRVMGSDSVTDCIANGNTVTITKSWNSDYKINVALSEDAKTSGLSATSGSISDGVLMCTYTQIKVNSDSQIYDLNTDWHLLVANGIVSGGIKSKHSTTPIRSTDVVDLQSNIVIPALTNTVTPSLSKPAACGVTMGCFTDGCDTNGDNCDRVVTWVDSTNSVTFTLSLATTGTADIWVALGLSSDNSMGTDSVTDCIATGTSVAVTKSYNTGRSNAALSSTTSGLSATSGSIANGVLMCTYTQTKPNSDAKIFDLSTSWYLLVANGAASGGTKTKHTTTPIRSTAVVDLQSNIVIPPPTNPVTPSLSKPTACGVTMGCFTDGCDTNGDNCDRVVTWVDSTSSVTFTLSLVTTGTADIWVALGLSSDNLMGGDSVTDCIATGTSVAVTKSYNTGRVNAALSSATSGLSASSGSIANGVLTCTYTQTKPNSDAKIFDLSTSWYLLVANGAASGGTKTKHTTTPIRSTAVVDLQSNIVIPPPTNPVTPSLSKPTACGVTMGCFTDGCDTNGDNCDRVVTWVDSTSSVTFTLSLATTGTADIWVALGLSTDNLMGGDSVTDCIATGTSVAVTKSYNTGRVNAALSSATSGLSASSGSIANGVLTCTFTQTKTNSDAKIFDLSTPWYLLVANGAASGGLKTKHTTTPLRSTAAQSFESHTSAASKITVKHTAIILTVMAIVYNTISY